MRSPLLYFLLLVLEIPLNLSFDAGHKQDIFSKTLLERNTTNLSQVGNTVLLFLT